MFVVFHTALVPRFLYKRGIIQEQLDKPLTWILKNINHNISTKQKYIFSDTA